RALTTTRTRIRTQLGTILAHLRSWRTVQIIRYWINGPSHQICRIKMPEFQAPPFHRLTLDRQRQSFEEIHTDLVQTWSFCTPVVRVMALIPSLNNSPTYLGFPFGRQPQN